MVAPEQVPILLADRMAGVEQAIRAAADGAVDRIPPYPTTHFDQDYLPVAQMEWLASAFTEVAAIRDAEAAQLESQITGLEAVRAQLGQRIADLEAERDQLATRVGELGAQAEAAPVESEAPPAEPAPAKTAARTRKA